MILKYYKSATDDGGAQGVEITSGTVNELFDKVRATELLGGLTEYRKMWIETDENTDIYNLLQSNGDFSACLFVSANPDTDTVAEITGNEFRHRQANITAATATDITVEYDTDMQYYNVGDLLYVGSAPHYDILSSFTDNADGTATLGLTNGIVSPANYVGQIASSMQKTTMVAGTAKAFWIKLKIDAGSQAVSNTETIPVLTIY